MRCLFLSICIAISTVMMLHQLAGGAAPPASSVHWPQWRGPNADGSSPAKNLPTKWSLTENIAWKTALPSWSGSTPVIWGDRVFVTSASAKPTTSASAGAQFQPVGFGGGGSFGGRRDPGGPSVLLLCLNKKNGAIIWERKLEDGNRGWMKQNSASPSPVTDGKHVWVVTGNGQIVAFDFDGNARWQRNLQTDYGKFGLLHGFASSPLLQDGKLIIQVLHGCTTDDPSYLVAFDAATGKPRWRVERPTDAIFESPDSYTTPQLAVFGGKPQIVLSGGDYVTGHDTASGKELWRAAGLNPNRDRAGRIIASPIVNDGIVYAPSKRRPLVALRVGGSGNVTNSHLVWKYEDTGGPDVPSPVCDGKYFYMIADNGAASCLDAKTGKVIYGPERTVVGTVSSSLVMADSKIYFINESGVTVVLASGPAFKHLATNELDGSFTLSSLAVSGNQLFARTSTHLYCIGK